MKRSFWLWFIALSALTLLPEFAHAQITSTFTIIVPVNQCNCTSLNSAPDWGCVLVTLKAVLQDAVVFATILIAILIAWTGIAYLMAPVNAEAKTKARQRLFNAVIGLVITLCAWLLIDSILGVIYNANASAGGVTLGAWNSVLSDTNTADNCIAVQSGSRNLPGLGLGNGTDAAANANGGTAGTGTSGAGGGGTTSGTCGSSSGLNCSAAISALQSNANPLNDYTGQCAQYVREALAAGGLTAFNSGQGNAYQYGGPLTSAGFKAVYTGTYSASSASAFAYQAGDVVVFQPVANHPYGHITMYTGSQWISDALQSNMASNQADYQGGSFTVYRP
jgi:hypothetical protein